MADTPASVVPETPAAPSAPVAPAAEPRSPETFTRDERRDWLQTGKVPSAATVDADDDPEPAAAPAVPAAASGPDLSRWVKTPPPAGVSKRQHERNELIRHATETEQRLRDLESQLQQRPAPTAPKTEPPPTSPAGQEYDGSDPSDPYPTEMDAFADQDDPYEARIMARLEWKQRKEQRKAQHAEQRTTAERWSQDLKRQHAERAQAYATARPDFSAKTEAVRMSIREDSYMGVWLMKSPIGPQVLEHMADHPEEFNRIARAPSPEAARDAFVRLEARLESSSPSPSTPAADAPAVPAPTPKLVSTAPPPPPTLGTRPAESADEEKAAVARDDFRAYKAAADRKEHARRRGQ